MDNATSEFIVSIFRIFVILGALSGFLYVTNKKDKTEKNLICILSFLFTSFLVAGVIGAENSNINLGIPYGFKSFLILTISCYTVVFIGYIKKKLS